MHSHILKWRYIAAQGKMAAAKFEMSAARRCHHTVTVAEGARNTKNNLRVSTYDV